MQQLLYVILGLAAGVLAGLFGVGGGVIMVTGMVALLHLPFTRATGTSLAAMLLPVGIFGVMEYWRKGNLEIRGALLLAAGLTVGAWLGARLAHEVAPAALQRAFAVFLVFMAVRLWMTA